ncbi:MAG: histidine phosphatase family protein [Oligoflexales bacterium]
MSTLIYYLRHAQSLHDSSKKTGDWHLTEHGYKQANKLADILAQINFAEIYSSPYLRCLETIAPYCKKNKLDYQCLDQLKERQLVLSYNKKNYQEIHRKSWIYFSFSLPGCESSKSAQERILATLKHIAAVHTGKQVLVSGHGQLLALALNYLNKSFGFNEQRTLLNPDLKIFKFQDDFLEVYEDPMQLDQEIRKIAVPPVRF